MRGAIPPLAHYVFMAWCLVKHTDSFTFNFYYGLPIINSLFVNFLLFSPTCQMKQRHYTDITIHNSYYLNVSYNTNSRFILFKWRKISLSVKCGVVNHEGQNEACSINRR
jgi:hypothetical protein